MGSVPAVRSHDVDKGKVRPEVEDRADYTDLAGRPNAELNGACVLRACSQQTDILHRSALSP